MSEITKGSVVKSDVLNQIGAAQATPAGESAAKKEDTSRQRLLELDIELREAEIEQKLLSNRLAKAQIIDTEDQLAERELKRESKFQTARTNGATLLDQARSRKKNQTKCNHRKGGNGQQDYAAGQGDDPQYAIYRHTFAGSNTEVFCLRCHRRWKKPLESEFVGDPSGFDAAKIEYDQAMNFPTKNAGSGSVAFTFKGKGSEDWFEGMTRHG
jgi:hypothetical protein